MPSSFPLSKDFPLDRQWVCDVREQVHGDRGSPLTHSDKREVRKRNSKSKRNSKRTDQPLWLIRINPWAHGISAIFGKTYRTASCVRKHQRRNFYISIQLEMLFILVSTYHYYFLEITCLTCSCRFLSSRVQKVKHFSHWSHLILINSKMYSSCM